MKPQKSQENTGPYRSPNLCWKCGQSGHHQVQCTANPNQKPENWKITAPISNCVAVLHGRSYVYPNGLVKKKPISCLLHSRSDLTLAPTEIIQKFKCEVKPAEITTLKAANCLNAMNGSTWFTTLHLRAGYHNIPVAEKDRDKTALITRRGCWRFKVMPFGLSCAPSVFQRLMDLVLAGLSYDICLIYLDDIIIYSNSFEEHLLRLEAVFERLRWAKLKLMPSKCNLLQQRVSFLGHVISKENIAMQTEKVEVVQK